MAHKNNKDSKAGALQAEVIEKAPKSGPSCTIVGNFGGHSSFWIDFVAAY